MTLLKNFSCVALLNMRKRALVFSVIFAVILMAGAGVSIATMMQATPTLRLQYRVADPTSPNDNQIKPHFNIVNLGGSSVPLSELKIRYWYTREGNVDVYYWVDSKLGYAISSGDISKENLLNVANAAYQQLNPP